MSQNLPSAMLEVERSAFVHHHDDVTSSWPADPFWDASFCGVFNRSSNSMYAVGSQTHANRPWNYSLDGLSSIQLN